MPNHLSNANSPYFFNTPITLSTGIRGGRGVDKGKAEDKPIFLSIGYAACHWCHVMAHESFEDSKLRHS